MLLFGELCSPNKAVCCVGAGSPAGVRALESTTELELKVRTEGKRLVELDALRGLAAVIVVGHHLRLFTWRFPLHWYSVPFFAGAQSVALFFVLSGFVLSLPYWRDRQLAYPTYVGRRLARIYLPYLAAAIVSVAADLVFRSSPAGLDHYFYGVWHSPVTPGSLWRLACIWPQASYNVSFWSLRYEMQLSIALPALLWLLRRYPNRWILLVSFTLANASIRLLRSYKDFICWERPSRLRGCFCWVPQWRGTSSILPRL